MKKLIFLAIGFLICQVVLAQKAKSKDVPELIRQSFNAKYPGAEEITWEKEGANYEAEFELNEVEISVLIDMAGEVLETETEITPNQLPAGVIEYMQTNYKGKKIKEAAKIVNNKGVVTFEVEIKGKELLFSSEGAFLKGEKIN